MTTNLPDYSKLKVPDGKPPEEYSHHERRADLLRRCVSMGSPFAVNQSNQAERYGVNRSTVSRDMKRLRESVGESIGDSAKLTARSVFERTLLDMRQADDWRASKAAFDVVMDWQEWLADIGEQEREPKRSEVGMDMDVRSRSMDVSYEIVREGDDEPLPEDESGETDWQALGFTNGPVGVEVTPDAEATETDHDGE